MCKDKVRDKDVTFLSGTGDGSLEEGWNLPLIVRRELWYGRKRILIIIIPLY